MVTALSSGGGQSIVSLMNHNYDFLSRSFFLELMFCNYNARDATVSGKFVRMWMLKPSYKSFLWTP